MLICLSKLLIDANALKLESVYAFALSAESRSSGKTASRPARSSMSTDLVGVASAQFFRHVQAAAVLYEATVGPVRVVEAEGAAAVAAPGVLDGDGAGHHGDDAAAACILLSLGGGRRGKTLEILKNADYFYSAYSLFAKSGTFFCFASFDSLSVTLYYGQVSLEREVIIGTTLVLIMQ